MNYTSHAPFGTSGGGSGYLKWENRDGDTMELHMDTGQVRINRWPERHAKVRVLPSGEWTPLVLPEPCSCAAWRGVTLLRYLEFMGVEDCYVQLHLPNKSLRIVRRAADRTPGAVELDDGYWYATVHECEVAVLE